MHHQKFDVERHHEKSKPTHKKLRAKDRPLANDFVSEVVFDRLLNAWFGNMARVLEPGRSFYVWGGYANLGTRLRRPKLMPTVPRRSISVRRSRKGRARQLDPDDAGQGLVHAPAPLQPARIVLR